MTGPPTRDFVHGSFMLFMLTVCLLLAPVSRAAGNDQAAESHSAAELVLRALSLLGVNYKFGGNSPDTGLDCSGLVRHVFREAVGVVLPRRAEEMSHSGENINTDQLRPGDLVFFNTLRRTFSHVGIYIGNDQFVHAPSRGGGVRVELMSKQYWIERFNGARRLIAGSLRADSVGDIASGAMRALPAGAAAFAVAQTAMPNLPLTGVALHRANPVDLLQIQPLPLN